MGVSDRLAGGLTHIRTHVEGSRTASEQTLSDRGHELPHR